MALAIFDLDETLIHGDCATLWSEQMARLGWVDGESFMRRNNELMDAYSHGKLAMEEFMDFSLEPLIGRTPEEVEHLVGPWSKASSNRSSSATPPKPSLRTARPVIESW